MKIKTFILSIAILCLGSTYVALYLLPKETLIKYTSEDNFFENVTAIGLFLSALVFIYLYVTSREGNNFIFLKTKRNIFLLLLALLFFFAAGEEISWGQRILGIKTPDAFSSNVQNETNIHNLDFLMKEYYNQEGVKVKQKSWVSKVLNVGTLTNAFWVIWAVFIPLLFKTKGNIRYFLEKVNIPYGSPVIGLLFILNYFLLHVARSAMPINNEHNEIKIVEIKEANMAFLFLALAITIWGKSKNSENSSNS